MRNGLLFLSVGYPDEALTFIASRSAEESAFGTAGLVLSRLETTSSLSRVV